MTDLATQIQAIRRSVALSSRGRDGLLRVEGPDAFDALDRLLPSELHVRNRGARPGLLLDDDGRIEADLVMLADGDDYVLLVEGLGAEAVIDRIRDATRPGEQVSARALDEHALLDLDGPYAWQVLGDLAGPATASLRFGSWYWMEPETLCLRAGQTGEYGYSFLLPRGKAEALRDRLLAAGQEADLVEASAEALSHCRLEAWFFELARCPGACPLEWGLQWRIQWDKPFRGEAALRARRGHTRAPAAFRADAPVPAGAPVTLDGQRIGEVGASSHATGETIGVALLEAPFAASGVSAYEALGVPLRTVSPPFVRYRSLTGLAGRARYVREP